MKREEAEQLQANLDRARANSAARRASRQPEQSGGDGGVHCNWLDASNKSYPPGAVVSIGRVRWGHPAVEDEADLHDLILSECRRRGWIAFHGSIAYRTRRTVGEPDFTIFREDGRFLMVECKTRTGKLSPAQRNLAHWAQKLGHKIHVVRSFADFLALL